MSWAPCLVESESGQIRLGHPLVDRYLEFVAARGRRNTLLAAAYDLKVFFSVVAKDPVDPRAPRAMAVAAMETAAVELALGCQERNLDRMARGPGRLPRLPM